MMKYKSEQLKAALCAWRTGVADKTEYVRFKHHNGIVSKKDENYLK